LPTETHADTDPQRYLLSTVRQSQAAVIDTIRTWTAVTEQLARTFRVPVLDVDFAGLVDRTFDVAEQTLAAQHELARTLAGVATRQVDTAVAAVETVADERVRQVEGLAQAAEAEQDRRDRERPDQPQAEAPNQDRRPDGRTYEERSVEELRERAGELQIEGRSSMSKDELIAALRGHRKSRSAKSDAAKSQESQPDRRTYEERSVEDLQGRARELQIEGRSAMSKDELIAALRKHAK
jgi:Rho termination factor, N-terminal domain